TRQSPRALVSILHACVFERVLAAVRGRAVDADCGADCRRAGGGRRDVLAGDAATRWRGTPRRAGRRGWTTTWPSRSPLSAWPPWWLALAPSQGLVPLHPPRTWGACARAECTTASPMMALAGWPERGAIATGLPSR